MRVLMVGATGRYAKHVVAELKKHGAVVRALVRNPDRAQEALRQGADDTAIGDLRDVESLRQAATDIDGVFHINPAFAPDEAELGVAMVTAARDARVRKFVFSGVIHPSLSRLTNHAAKLAVEQAIYESGLEFTVLQPTMFMQTIELGWAQVIEHARFGVPYSRLAKASYVDYRDVAEAVALALTGDKLAYGTFELCAPGMLSRVDLASLMSQALEREIEAAEPSFAEWARMAHVPDGPVWDGLKRMYEDYEEFGFPGGNSLVLEAVLGREPRTMEQFVWELVGPRPNENA